MQCKGFLLHTVYAKDYSNAPCNSIVTKLYFLRRVLFCKKVILIYIKTMDMTENLKENSSWRVKRLKIRKSNEVTDSTWEFFFLFFPLIVGRLFQSPTFKEVLIILDKTNWCEWWVSINFFSKFWKYQHFLIAPFL